MISELGQPSGTFEEDRIISYRLGKRSGKYFMLDQKTEEDIKRGALSWLSGFEGRFSLVLVFDENHVLQKHSVVKVQ